MKNIINLQGVDVSPNPFQVETNKLAPVYCHEMIEISAPLGLVWNAITDINSRCKWNPEIAYSKLERDLAPENHFEWKSGGSTIHSSLHTVEAESQFGWSGKALGICAVHNWTFHEQNGLVTVRSEESMEGFLAGFFKAFLKRKTSSSLKTWLQRLKEVSEHSYSDWHS